MKSIQHRLLPLILLASCATSNLFAKTTSELTLANRLTSEQIDQNAQLVQQTITNNNDEYGFNSAPFLLKTITAVLTEKDPVKKNDKYAALQYQQEAFRMKESYDFFSYFSIAAAAEAAWALGCLSHTQINERALLEEALKHFTHYDPILGEFTSHKYDKGLALLAQSQAEVAQEALNYLTPNTAAYTTEQSIASLFEMSAKYYNEAQTIEDKTHTVQNSTLGRLRNLGKLASNIATILHSLTLTSQDPEVEATKAFAELWSSCYQEKDSLNSIISSKIRFYKEEYLTQINSSHPKHPVPCLNQSKEIINDLDKMQEAITAFQ